MAVLLPPKIEAFFAASNAAKPEGVAAAFSPQGEVHDEHAVHRGRDAIAAWAHGSQTRYRMQSEPLTLSSDGPGHRVTARVAGDFPGSPLTLTYQFILADDGVQSLEIG
jgi:hypothetical protein